MPPIPHRTVLLPSEGYVDGRPTRHVFVREDYVPASQLIAVDIELHANKPGYAQIYRCVETGAERRWGLHLERSFTIGAAS